MARFLFLLGIFAWCSIGLAGPTDDFRIKGMRQITSTDLILVGRDWVKDPRRLLVTIRVPNDTDGKTVKVRAYFYDKDGKQVAKVDEPNPIWTSTNRGVQEVGLPATLEKNKDIDVYFALTQELEAKKWKSIVVVFGNDTAVAARSFPTTALATLDFPEKGRMIKEQN